MKNNVVLEVTGNNINRFLRRLIKNDIYIYDLKKISNKKIIITINTNDLDKVYDLKGTYDTKVIKYIGLISYKDTLRKNSVICIFLIFSLLFIILLSNFIFEIKIYHTNSSLKETIIEELKNNGIKPFSFRKSFDEISKIKENILTKYKDKIEWLEITRVGTVYNIRVEERIINKDNTDNTPQNIVASKQGIIKKIYAKNGVILKSENEYVSKGDVIISGEVYLNESLKGVTKAEGKVYAETWYTVKLDFPLYYREEISTGNKKTVFNIRFLNKDYNLFGYSKYRNYKSKNIILYESNLLPLSLMIQRQEEVNVIENIYNKETDINKGIEYATKKIEETLSSDEYIISKKVLKNVEKNSTIYMEIFFKIYEDITSTSNIIIPEEENI